MGEEVEKIQEEEKPLTGALAEYMAKENVPAVLQKSLAEHFQPFLDQTKEWKEKAEALEITDVSQIKEMEEARTARLALVKVRTGIDKLRKQLNAGDTERIKARNLIADYVTEEIPAIEKILKDKEDFIENETAKLREGLKNHRLELLKPYGANTEFYDLAKMPQELFNKLLEDSAILWQAKQEREEKAAEAERLEKLKAERHAKLINLGLSVAENGNYIHEIGTDVHNSVLIAEEEKFDLFYNTIKNKIAEIEEEKREAAEKLAIKNEIISMRLLALQRLGFYPVIGEPGEVPKLYRNLKYELEVGANMLDVEDKPVWDRLITEMIDAKAVIDKKERERLDKEAKEKKAEEDRIKAIKDGIINERSNSLESLGFVNNGTYLKYGETSILIDTLANADSSQWLLNLNKIAENVAEIKAEAEEARIKKEAEEKAEAEAKESDKAKIDRITGSLTTLLAVDPGFKSKKNKEKHLQFKTYIQNGINILKY